MIKIDDELFKLLKPYGFENENAYLFEVLDWLFHNYGIIINVYPEYSKAYEIVEYRVKIYVQKIDEVEEHFIKRLWCERPCDGLRVGIETSLKFLKENDKH